MMRATLLYLSTQPTLRRWMETSSLSRPLTKRFVAGMTLDEEISVVRRLNAELNKIVMQPDVTARFAAIGAEPVAIAPETFSALVRSQMVTVKDIVVRAKIPLE